MSVQLFSLIEDCQSAVAILAIGKHKSNESLSLSLSLSGRSLSFSHDMTISVGMCVCVQTSVIEMHNQSPLFHVHLFHSDAACDQSSNQQMESINQTHPNNQAINRCINQSSNQAINRCINQSSNQQMEQAINRCINQQM